jgi:heterodisulfide reductase subunit C
MTQEQPKTVNPEFTKEAIKAGADTVTLCFQCGTCTGSCPSGRHTAFRTRKLLRKVQLGFRDEVLPSDDLWLCTTCYTCYERCPRGVHIVDIILALRNMAVKEGYMAQAHKNTAAMLIKSGHTVPVDDKFKAMRKSLGLPEIPPTTLADPKALQDLQKIIHICGFDKLIAGGK